MHKVAGKTGKNTTRVETEAEAEAEAEAEREKGQHHQTVPTLMGSFPIPTAFALKLQLELETEGDGVGVAIGIGIGMMYAVVWRGEVGGWLCRVSITSSQLTAALSFTRSMAGPISTYPKTAHCSCACLVFVLTQRTHTHRDRGCKKQREKSLKCRAARQLGKSEKRHPQNETDIHIIIIRVFTLASMLHLGPDLWIAMC